MFFLNSYLYSISACLSLCILPVCLSVCLSLSLTYSFPQTLFTISLHFACLSICPSVSFPNLFFLTNSLHHFLKSMRCSAINHPYSSISLCRARQILLTLKPLGSRAQQSQFNLKTEEATPRITFRQLRDLASPDRVMNI